MEETLWCCVGTDFRNKPYYAWSTLSYTRRDSKIKFLPEQGNYTSWDIWKKKGWVCIKVKMKLTPLCGTELNIEL